MPDPTPRTDARALPMIPVPAAHGAGGSTPARAGAVPPAIAAWALSAWTPSTRPGLVNGPRPAADRLEPLIDAATHDLRNALSAIRLGVELLRRRGGADGAERANPASGVLAHVDSAAIRAHERSDELADLCRLAAGHEIATVPARFSLHALVQQALDAMAPSAAGIAFDHDRLGHGDSIGDPARIAQFLQLALEEIVSAPSSPALVIVISEIAGDRYRVAVMAAPPGAAVAAGGAVHDGAAGTRRRVLLDAIARSHGGRVRIDSATSGQRVIEGSFHAPRSV